MLNPDAAARPLRMLSGPAVQADSTTKDWEVEIRWRVTSSRVFGSRYWRELETATKSI